MSKQRRSLRQRNDPIRDLQEWQNHQYDPGYLDHLRPLRLFAGGRASVAGALLIGLGAMVAFILVVFGLVSAGLTLNIAALIVGVGLLTLLSLLSVTIERNSRRRRRRRRSSGARFGGE